MNSPPVVLVTGASRGLGRGIAETLAADGMSVAIHYAGNREAAEATQAACLAAATSTAQQFELIQADIGDSDQREAVLPATLAAFGHLDALVNNAGITSVGRKDILEASEGSSSSGTTSMKLTLMFTAALGGTRSPSPTFP